MNASRTYRRTVRSAGTVLVLALLFSASAYADPIGVLVCPPDCDNPAGNSLTLTGTGELQAPSLYTNGGDFSTAVGATLTIQHGVSGVADASFLNSTGATLANQGTVLNRGTLTNSVGAALTNFGMLNQQCPNPAVQACGDQFGTLVNHGTLDNALGATLFEGRINNFGTLTNWGSIDFADSLVDVGLNNASGAAVHNFGTLRKRLESFGTVVNHAGATLTNSLGWYRAGSMDNFGTVNQVSGGNEAVLTNHAGAAFVVQPALSEFMNSGSIWNEGTLTNLSNGNGTAFQTSVGFFNRGPLVNAAGATFNNAGRMLNTGPTATVPAVIINQGTFNNTGVLFNGCTETFTICMPLGGTIENAGVLNNQAGATLSNLRGRFINRSGGTLNNSGTLNHSSTLALVNEAGATLNNAGTLNSNGVLDNFGVLSIKPGGTLVSSRMLTTHSGSLLENYGTLRNLAVVNERLEIRAGALLNNYGSLENVGRLDNLGTLTNAGTLLNSGTLFSAGTASLVNTAGATMRNAGTVSGPLDNFGMLVNEAAGTIRSHSPTVGTLTNHAGATLDNFGVVEIQQGSSFLGFGTLTNDGTLRNRAGATLFGQGTLTNGGTLLNELDGLVTTFRTVTNEAGATISNSGQFDSLAQVINQGTVLNDGFFIISPFSGSFDNLFLVENRLGGHLDNFGPLYNDFSGTLSNAGGTFRNLGLLDNFGTLSNTAGGGLINTSSGGLTNHGVFGNLEGTVTNEFAGVLTNAASGHLTNAGLVRNEGTLINAGQLNNSGTIAGSGAVQITLAGTLNNTATGTLEASDLLVSGVLNNNGYVRISGGSPLDILAGGLLAGTGTIDGDVLNEGTVAPGGPGIPGAMLIDGDYIQTAQGAFEVRLGGEGEGAYDQLRITGMAMLAGALNVWLLPGFDIDLGDMFTLMTFDLRFGTFGDVNLPDLASGLRWLLAYNDTDITLTAASVPTGVPAPGTLLLLLIGLAGLLAGGRIRLRRTVRAA